MKKILIGLCLLPALCFAKCNLPWEEVKPPIKNYAQICRMTVPHGWLVWTTNGNWATSTTIFMKDEQHEWVLEP